MVVGLLALSALIPIVGQWRTAPELGLVWQGRYHLPAMVGLPLVAGVALASNESWSGLFSRRWSVGCVVGVLCAAQIGAFWGALHDSVIGGTGPWIGFTPLWQPPLGWIPLTCAFAVVVTVWTVTLLSAAPTSPRDSGRVS